MIESIAFAIKKKSSERLFQYFSLELKKGLKICKF